MTYEELKQVVNDEAALRYRARLQPAGGPGTKVFPPTYAEGQYAVEGRTIEGEKYTCVHLDSVQSQANRMELALLEAIRDGRVEMPLIEVQFPDDDPLLRGIGSVSHLEAPHRIADAILRDSLYEGTRFRESDIGRVLDTASLANATGLFEVAPTSLLFGLWDSTGPLGGLGAKFQRAIASEIVGVGAEIGVKTSSRVDPLGITLSAGPVYVEDEQTGEWTLEEKRENGKKRSLAGKTGRPSEVNHGNVTPTINETNGGVTFDYALQSAVISMPAIRRLRFPVNGEESTTPIDAAARSVLAATGILGVSLATSKGVDLRTRTLLVPEQPPEWEVVRAEGTADPFSCSVSEAIELYDKAVEEARSRGLRYRTEPVRLEPSPGLLELVRRSKEISRESGGE